MSKRLNKIITLLAVIPLLLSAGSVYANTAQTETNAIKASSGEAKMQLAKGQNNLPQQKGKDKSSCS